MKGVTLNLIKYFSIVAAFLKDYKKGSYGLGGFVCDSLVKDCVKSYADDLLTSVIPEGFEPSTYCLEGSCSIR